MSYESPRREKNLTPAEEERLEALILKEVAHIDDPNNKQDEILRMSSEEEKRSIARLRVQRAFEGQSGPEYTNGLLR